MNQTKLIILVEYHRDLLVYLLAIQLKLAVSLLNENLQLVCFTLLLSICFDQWNLLLIFIQIKDFSVMLFEIFEEGVEVFLDFLHLHNFLLVYLLLTRDMMSCMLR